eukprot:TRINITY_DN91442_c0_g1_i1.p1 TRINITY_DN91442_c0_g1~~TRINITY_DN91442_c0_g1_i1.p1  ORF type:complete len:592 (+),score=114.86 TRINITY_DN91442_c0_g1_i1:113-1777(+)
MQSCHTASAADEDNPETGLTWQALQHWQEAAVSSGAHVHQGYNREDLQCAEARRSSHRLAAPPAAEDQILKYVDVSAGSQVSGTLELTSVAAAAGVVAAHEAQRDRQQESLEANEEKYKAGDDCHDGACGGSSEELCKEEEVSTSHGSGRVSVGDRSLATPTSSVDLCTVSLGAACGAPDSDSSAFEALPALPGGGSSEEDKEEPSGDDDALLKQQLQKWQELEAPDDQAHRMQTESSQSAAPRELLLRPLLERYDPLAVTGIGSLGTVFRAWDRHGSETVAVKWMRSRPPKSSGTGVPTQIMREVQILLGFEAPNVVQLLEVHATMLEYVLVFEHVEGNLAERLEQLQHEDVLMPLPELRQTAKQLMQGVQACHCRQILHRDLKPENILISEPSGVVKICDFGLSRNFSPASLRPLQPFTANVVSLWYRAPEMLLGATLYSTSVDIWSAGCVVGEMATGDKWFPGDSEIGTLFNIFNVLGTPHEAIWPGVTKLPHFKHVFPKWRPSGLRFVRELRPSIEVQDLQAMLQDMLRLAPAQRPSARDALQYAFLQAN